MPAGRLEMRLLLGPGAASMTFHHQISIALGLGLMWVSAH